MENLFSEAAPLLVFLLPGFLAAWILYGLTSHPKPSQFERTVEALVLTFLIHVFVESVGQALTWVGRWATLGEWNAGARLVWAAGAAIALGGGLANALNTDTFHSWLRRKGFTSRTSHPSEWFCVLDANPAFVVLQLQDGRRLTGWPKEWPISPSAGQFYIQLPAWIQEDGAVLDLPQLDGILIQATDVKWVELFPKEKELNDDKSS